MKTCPKCKAQFSDDISFCQNCGTPLSAASSSAAMKTCPVCKNQCAADENFCQKCGYRFDGAAPVPPVPTPTDVITLQQYYESHADPKLKKSISSMFWVVLVLAIINFVIAIVNGMFPLDGLALLGLALFWKCSPGVPCAVLAIVYAVISLIVGLANGVFTGWLIPVAAIFMFVYAQKLNKAYNEFITNRK